MSESELISCLFPSLSVKIQNIRFSNLYSYEYCDIPLDNYNIVVGPNASGKTNIIRVLKLLLEGNIYENLENVTIKNELRFNPTNDSWINMDVEFSDEEARLLAQFILLKTIKPDDKVVETLRSGSIIIGWSRTPDLDNIKPDLLAIRFPNDSQFQIQVLQGVSRRYRDG